MSRYWSEAVKSLTPYMPGEQPKDEKIIKLNTNEHPYGPSPRVLIAIAQATTDSLRLYPDPESHALRRAIAKNLGLSDAEIFVGNGSDEVLAHVFCALLKHEKPILFSDITYSFYPVYSELYGINYEVIPLDEQFNLNLADYERPNGGIIFANPNAGTGKAVPRRDIETLLEKNSDSVIVVDEAYVDFGAESAVSLVRSYPHLLVVQTFSKSRALAGMRIGFAVGNPDLIEGLSRVKNSFNSYPLDRLALVAAQAAIEDQTYFETMNARVIQSRQWLVSALSERQFHTIPSSANFILSSHASIPGETLFQELRKRGVLVRYFKTPRLENSLRITIGTQEDCEALVAAMDDIFLNLRIL